MKIQRAKLTSPTGRGVLLDPIWPNVGVRMWYQIQLDALTAQMHAEITSKVLPAAREVSPILGADSTLAADVMTMTQMQRNLEKWGTQWVRKFDLMSRTLADDFATRAKRATEASMRTQFARAGFTISFQVTPRAVAAYQAVAAEQVGLIKSIPQKYLTDVQTQVWQAVKRGGDLRTLATNLEKTYNVTKKRAALIARDQNAKAKATIEGERLMELGVKQGVWMHSRGGKVPRPTHVAMNRKLYELSKGMWDAHEKEFVHPGSLINCRCSVRPYIPGFEAPMPEWGIAST